MGRKMGKDTKGRLSQMGQLVGKKGLIERKKRKRSKRKEEKRKKRGRKVNAKTNKMRGEYMFRTAACLRPYPHPSQRPLE